MTLITYRPKTLLGKSWIDDFWNFDGSSNLTTSFNPYFDISQNDSSYFISADLPGIDKKNINISLSDEMITISGERENDLNHKDNYQTYSYKKYGSFEKSFFIPDDANTQKIDAKMENGVLLLEIKKVKNKVKSSKKITIK